jgi:hypothetical protein
MREIDTVIDGMTERSSPARDDLALTDAQVAEMSAQERAARVEEVKVEANTLLDWAVQEHVTGQQKTLVATVILFSGGNDSTVMAHLMRGRATHAAHANTTIGIEEPRCSKLPKPLANNLGPQLATCAGSAIRTLISLSCHCRSRPPHSRASPRVCRQQFSLRDADT